MPRHSGLRAVKVPQPHQASGNRKHGAGVIPADEVHARAVPMVAVVPSLLRNTSDIWPEGADAASPWHPHAVPRQSVAPSRPQSAPLDLRRAIVVRVQDFGNGVHVVKAQVHAPDQDPEVRSPARILMGGGHESLVMMDGLGQRHLLAQKLSGPKTVWRCASARQFTVGDACYRIAH